MKVVSVSCDSCGQPVSHNPKRVITTYWPRESRVGVALDGVVAQYCGVRCSQVAHNRKRDVSERCRPWCVSIAKSASYVCDCTDEAPGYNFDPCEAAGL